MKTMQQTIILQQILNFCQLIIALLWLYQGLIPKLIFQVADEQYIWQQLHVPTLYISWMVSLSGIAEMIFGLLFLFFAHKFLHWLNIIALTGLLLLILLLTPQQLYQAFNPLVMNTALASLSIIAIWCIQTLEDTKPE